MSVSRLMVPVWTCNNIVSSNSLTFPASSLLLRSRCHWRHSLLVMNSLTYLSRQFDVLASAKTPPSTPTAERHSFIRKGRTSASTDDLQQGKKRSSTSSFSQPAQTPLSSRSYSSPALFTLARATALSSTPTSSSSHEPDVPSKSYNDLFRRVFLIRVLVIAWGGLRSAWSSLLKLLTGDDPVIVNVTIDKVRNEKSVDDSTTSEPHLPSQSILTVHLPPIGRSHTDPTFPFDATPEPTSPTLQSSSPSAMTVNDSQAEGSSRASTPMLMTRKTPFHLPKTLVLDLDETLIHSTSRPISTSSARSGIFGLGVGGSKGGGHVVEVVLGGRSTLYHVYKRPFADFFLRTVRVVFLGTAYSDLAH